MKFTNLKNRVAELSKSNAVSTIKLPEGMELYKLKDGINKISIVPFLMTRNATSFVGEIPYANKGEYHWETTFVEQRIEQNGSTKVFVVPEFLDKEDPRRNRENKVFTAVQKIKEEYGWEATKPFAQKRKQAFYVYCHVDKKIKLLVVSSYASKSMVRPSFSSILTKRISAYSEDNPDILEKLFSMNEDGFQLNVECVESTFNGKKFAVVEDISLKRRGFAINPKHWKNLPMLQDLLMVPSSKELAEYAKMVKAPSVEDNDDDSNDDLEAVKPSKKNRFDDDDSNDDLEAVKPSKKNRFDDDDSNDDLEAVKPSKKNRF